MENGIEFDKESSWEFNTTLSSFHEWLLHTDYSTTRQILITVLKKIDNVHLIEKLLHTLSTVKQEDFVSSFLQAKSSLNGYRQSCDSIPNVSVKSQMSRFHEFFESSNLKRQLIIICSMISRLQNSQILHEAHQLLSLMYCKRMKSNNIPDQDEANLFMSMQTSDFSQPTEENVDIHRYLTTGIYDMAKPLGDALFTSASGKDAVSKLPLHLIKKILGYVDERHLLQTRLVCKRWNVLIKQIMLESLTRQDMREEAMMMQGASAKQAHPSFARKRLIAIPCGSLGYHQQQDLCDVHEVEERNVYCGAYNVLVLDHETDSKRCVSYSDGSAVVTSCSDRIVKTLCIDTGQPLFTPIRGHPGTITSLHITSNDNELIFSGGYDTTIRCWLLGSCRCKKIMHSHRDSVVCLDSSKDKLVSGGKDGLVKVWDIATGKCTCTFKHSKYVSVTAVKIKGNVVVSSCERGLIKVWNLEQRKLTQVLRGHHAEIKCLAIDGHFIVSGGNDAFVRSWTVATTSKQCLKAFRHPREVLCVQLLFLRIISGCADGKIRVLNLLSGECVRVFRGNSKCDPVLSLSTSEERLVVNTVSNVLLLQFEPVQWKYQTSDDDEAVSNDARFSSAFHRSEFAKTRDSTGKQRVPDQISRSCESRLGRAKPLSTSRPCSASRLMRFDYGLRLSSRPQTAGNYISRATSTMQDEDDRSCSRTSSRIKYLQRRSGSPRSKTFDDGTYLKIANTSVYS